jgi:predicted XRE-type DNA-binding protein
MNPTTVQITHGSDNVFADLGFAPEIAANLKIRADLMLALREIIQSRAWSIEQASQSLQESPATIENLLQGEIDQFTVEQLIPILTRCGCQINLQVIPVAASKINHLASRHSAQKLDRPPQTPASSPGAPTDSPKPAPPPYSALATGQNSPTPYTNSPNYSPS